MMKLSILLAFTLAMLAYFTGTSVENFGPWGAASSACRLIASLA